MRELTSTRNWANYSTVAAFLDARRSSRIRLRLAIDIARRARAHLIAIFVELPPEQRSRAAAESFARGTGMTGVSERYHESEEREAFWHREQVEQFSRNAGLVVEWRKMGASSTLRDAVAQCRYADIAILPQATPLKHADRPMLWTSGDIVVSAGMPCVYVPERYAADGLGRRIAIAWNATREARRAVSDALPFFNTAERVDIIVIDPRTSPSAHGPDPGFDIAQFLARHGVRADVERVESSGAVIGEVLLNRARALQADLIVAGAHGHSPMVEMVLGSTTRALLEHADIPMLLSH